MSLAAHLRDHHQHLTGLLDLLTRERALLAAGAVDGDALARVAGEKQHQLALLEQFETRRRAVQQRLGYRNNPDGDEGAAREQHCLPLWQRIRADARHAARLNRVNGELIGLRMESNQRLLNDLRALAGEHLYGPDGQARGADAGLSSQA